MEIELIPFEADGRFDADILWLPDQPSPFGESEPPPYQALLLHKSDNVGSSARTFRYRAQLVTGKDGPPGAIQLLALVCPLDNQLIEDAFRHWDEHIPLAVKIHHKATRYRQFRFVEKRSPNGPDYMGLAVLDFASPDDLRTGLYRNEADMRTIADDVADFIGKSDVMFATERSRLLL